MGSRRGTKLQLFIIVIAYACGYFSAHFSSLTLLNKHDVQEASDSEIRSNLVREKSNDQQQGPKKYFLDCGANIASSIKMFREVYPDSQDYIIHSFEIDVRLRPYFTTYIEDGKTFPHIPLGVSDSTGNITAFMEGAWFPGKINLRRPMQWGGGGLFPKQDEIDNKDGLGGVRKRNIRVNVPTVDLSEWIRTNTRKEDYVIFKLDVEGAEYGIIEKMLADETFDWVDKFYCEFHPWELTKYHGKENDKKRNAMHAALEKKGFKRLEWAGEFKRITDFDKLVHHEVPDDTPGSPGKIIDSCKTTEDGKPKLAIVIEIGMDAYAARRLVATIGADRRDTPLTLFVYGDFVKQNVDLVKEWSNRYEIGIRIGRNWPMEYWAMQRKESMKMDFSVALRKFKDAGFSPAYVYPSGLNDYVVELSKQFNLRIINSTYTFPPRQGTSMTLESYFKHSEVERTPRALDLIHRGLNKKGGFLSLDSDFPDCFMTSIFLLDYLYDVSPHHITSLRNCLS